MTGRLRFDFQKGTLDTGIDGVEDTISSPELAGLGEVVAPDFAVIVLDPLNVALADPELAYITDHATGATTATVLRGQEGTLARPHAVGIEWRGVATALDYDSSRFLPEWYGAVGDGVADDSDAIIAAAYAARGPGASGDADSGGVVWFNPASKYRVTKECLFFDCDNVHFASDGAQILLDDQSTWLARFRFNACSHVSVKGLRFAEVDPMVRTREGVAAVWVQNSDDVDVSGCYFTNLSFYGVLFHAVEDGAIHHNTILSTAVDGIHVQVVSKRVTVTENRLTDTGDDAIGISADGNVPCQQITVANNQITNSGSSGIACYGGLDIAIVDNIIDGTFVGGITLATWMSRIWGCRVAGNIISNAGSHLTETEDLGGYPGGIVYNPGAYSTLRIVVEDNLIYNPVNGGILFNGSGLWHLSIRNNDVYGPISDISWPLGDPGVPSGTQQLDFVRHCGIYVDRGETVDISGNRTFETQAEGIYVASGVEGVLKISDNIIQDSCTDAGFVAAIVWASGDEGAVITGNVVWDPNANLTNSLYRAGGPVGEKLVVKNNYLDGLPVAGLSGIDVTHSLAHFKTWDPGSIADGAVTSTTIVVPGATTSGADFCQAAHSSALPAGAFLVASVTAADTVTVTLVNHSGSALDLATGTLRVRVEHHY